VLTPGGVTTLIGGVMPHQQRESVPTYEGRPLPRPDEELVDQGLGFDLGTVLGRRRMLQALGLGIAGVGLAACGSSNGSSSSSSATSSSASASPSAAATTAAGATSEIPEETAGPYPGDGSNGPNVLDDSGIVRADITKSFGDASGTAEGVPMTLELDIKDLANGGSAFAGTAVYVWHCDREGRYSMYSEGVTDENYLRGVQIADSAGKVRFTSVFPGCYPGRWPHIHFEVYPDQASITDSSNAIATSQVALPKDVCEKVYATSGYEQSVPNLSRLSLSSDNVFGDDGGASQLGTASGDVSSGYTVTLSVGIDTTTTAGRGGGAPSR
jgi:protocatechuate 3,4-dioxygenase beta subunit